MNTSPVQKNDNISKIRITDYCSESIQEYSVNRLNELTSIKDGYIRWIDVDNGVDKELRNQLESIYNIHPVVLSSILEKNKRPKLEDYEDYLFVNATMIHRNNDTLVTETLNIIIKDNYVISIGNMNGDVFDDLRKRIRTLGSHIRKSGTDYLLYSILDSITDVYFDLLYDLEEKIDKLEEEIIKNSSNDVLAKIRELKNDILSISKSIIPLKESRSLLISEPSQYITDTTLPYMKDVYNHMTEAIEMVENCREMVVELMELFYTTASNNLNKIIKVLTIISTIFIPLTFIVGLYGMNFKYMPEFGFKWSYPILWVIMLSVTAFMVLYFKKKKWF
ncbi:MAG TPA: magnesium/cobalt transporter CorA [Clostridia bacterium]|nr:magnesium/cobalt transporter CorA [Clostridia bacterium]